MPTLATEVNEKHLCERPLWRRRRLRGLLVSGALVAAALPVAVSQPAGAFTDPEAWAIQSAGFSASAETALLAQAGLLTAPGLLPRAASAGYAPAPSGQTDVRVNLPGKGEVGAVDPTGGTYGSSPACNTQVEVSLARTSESLVAAWVDGGQCDKLLQYDPMYLTDGAVPLTGLSMSGYGYSRDGGAIWNTGTLPVPNGENLFGNPSIAAGPGGSVYYATLMGTPLCCDIGVSKSSDGGQTWSVAVKASGNSDPAPQYLHDKPWIAVDRSPGSPYGGAVYVAWTKWVRDELRRHHMNAVLLSRSTDGGQTFSPPVKLSGPGTGEAEEYPGMGTQVAVGPGGEVYVVWVDPSAEEERIWFVRSLDGGETFSAPVRIVHTRPIGTERACAPSTTPTRRVLNGDIRVPYNFPSMAVDTSGSSQSDAPDFNPDRGTIYLTLPHDPVEDDLMGFVGVDQDESDVAFIYSRDTGLTWEHVEKVGDPDATWMINDDVGADGVKTKTDQFHPNVAVDDHGRVAVSWYDRRPIPSQVAPSNWEITVFVRISEDGGRSFEPSVQVSDVPFPPSRTNPNTNWMGGCYMGLYNGLTAGDEEFLAAWGDNRDHIGPVSDMNVYFDRIALG